MPSPSSSSGQLAPPTPKASGTGANLPSDYQAASAEKPLGGANTGGSTETRSGADPARDVSEATLNRQSSQATDDATTAPGAQSGALGAAEAAPRQRWLSYVWPAVALGPFAKALAILLPNLEDVNSLLPPGVGRLFTQVLGIAASGGGQSLFERSAMSSRPDPYPAFTPGGAGMSLFVTILTVLAVLIGVVALARLTVGEEFFSMRWLH